MEIVAHRGASHAAPENTLAAVELAWEQGADAVEIDVRLSADAQIVLQHDPTTLRTGGVDRPVHQQTLAELRTLDVGRWKDERWTGERIPTLAEVLDDLPAGRRLWIEIKCGHAILPPLQRVLRESRRPPEQLVLISFSLPLLRSVKRQLPELPAFWVWDIRDPHAQRTHQDEILPENSSLVAPPPVTGASSGTTGVPGGGEAFGGTNLPGVLNLPQRAPTSAIELVLTLAGRAGVDGVDLSPSQILNPACVERIHARGLQVGCWTVDDPELAAQARDAGVDSITTNHPGLLRAALPTDAFFRYGPARSG